MCVHLCVYVHVCVHCAFRVCRCYMRPYLKINKWKRKSRAGRSSLGVCNLRDLDYEPRWADTSGLMQLCVTCHFHLEILSDGFWDTTVTLRCSQVHIWGFPCLLPLRCLSSFQLPSLLPRFDEVYARSYCFSAHYIYHLLVNGYKFTEETWPQIRFEKEVSQSTNRFLVFLAIERLICMNVEERSKVKGWPNLADCLWTPQKEVTEFKVVVLRRLLQMRRLELMANGWVRKEGVSRHERCQPSAWIGA